jgi:O-glycosyl hydrolase
MKRRHHKLFSCFVEVLEQRRLLATVTLDPSTTYQTIQGWGTAGVYPTNLVTVAQAGAIMRDAGMNVVRVTPSANDYTYTVGGNMRTPVPISANLDQNVARFNPNSNNQTDLINWLETNALEPDRVKMIGSLWSPPYWMKITTGTLMNWDNGGPQSGYDPIIPWGDYGANTGAGRVNPTMWTDWARYVLSTVEWWQQKTGLPMYAFSFQNEPNVPATYNSAVFDRIANDVNNPSAGYTEGNWSIYGDAVQALANELALHPEITTKFFGPELSQLGGGASNPYNLPSYNAIRQNLISRGLLSTLGAYATHEYTDPADDAVMWDAWYNGSAHAAQIVNGTNNLGWLGPTPGIAGDNKEIWQTETEGEAPTWTKDGAMGFGLKIFNSLVYGNVSGYTTWNLVTYNHGDSFGLVDINDINNPTNSYKYDAFKQFSRWIRPGAQRINATFSNGNATTGGSNSLDSYDGLNVAAFKQAQDKRLTMVFVNMETTDQSTTITIPAGVSSSSYQVYETTGTQKYVQLSDLVPSNGQITITVPASSIVTITGSYAANTLPAPYVSNDIGSPSPGGSAAYDAGTGIFTVSGGGSDIWNSSDQFQFVSEGYSGNGAMVARVNSITNTNSTSAKAGVMFRDSTAANAAYAFAWLAPNGLVHFETRAANGASSSYSANATAAASAWLKVIRAGASSNQFSAYFSLDGSSWTQIGAMQTISMNSNAQIGLAVTSHNNGTLCTSTFSGISIISAPTLSSGTFNYKTGQSLSFTFSEDVLTSLSAVDFVITNTTTSTIVPAGEFTFGVTGGSGVQSVATLTHKLSAGILPNGNYSVAISNVSDAAGNAMSPTSWPFFVLAGDANHDGYVNLFDFNALAQNFGTAGAAYDKGDFNYDGVVNALDLNALATYFGATSPGVASMPVGATAMPAQTSTSTLFSANLISSNSSNDLLNTLDQRDSSVLTSI